MALELGLVDGDVLDRHSHLPRHVLHHPIHQGEGIAMGQKALDLLTAKNHRVNGV
jgi:hypothetical protein